MSNIDLKEVFTLIKTLKQGIKQKCSIEITDSDVGISDRGLRIRVEGKNYKTKKYMYFERIITETEIFNLDGHYDSHSNLINNTIKKVNYHFIKEQGDN